MLNDTLSTDTICALATPPGGAIGVIRLSGPDTFSILSRVFSRNISEAAGNTIHYGNIVDKSSPAADASAAHGVVIDEVLVSIFRAPHSYTGEDSAEISCHGSRYILSAVMQLLVDNGARAARPGEYTQRAFINGKLDLSQAEAVADLIASTNRASHHIAMSQLKGHFSSKLSQLRDQLLHLTTLLELELDFSDHEELEFADRSELLSLANDIDSHIMHLAHSFETGQAIKNGIPVAIIGKTNAGKSTLLNQLLGEERAIVSDVHGTTRDTIEDCIDINGISFRFIDTAGIRATSDTVEQIGIERTYKTIDRASIVVWLVDEKPVPADVAEMLAHLKGGKKLIVARNKVDLLSDASTADSLSWREAIAILLSDVPFSFVSVSAKTGMNISALKQSIYNSADLPEINESDTIVSTARHYDALMQAHVNLQRVISSMHDGISGDLIAEDLRLVLDNLADITGTITPQDTLNNVFSHFCIGK